MIGGVTCHMLPHLAGVPQLHVNRSLGATETLAFFSVYLAIVILFIKL